MSLAHTRGLMGVKVQRTRRHVVALLLGSVFWTAEAGAQNLLQNAMFDDANMLASWSTFGGADGTQIHDPAEDVGGVAASGAVELTLNAAAAVGAQSGVSQCVGVTANTLYNYGTRVKMPTGQATGEVGAWIDVEFFSDASCGTSQSIGEAQGTLIGSINYALSNTVWYGIPGTVPGGAQTVTAPVGAGSVLVRLFVERESGRAVAVALFDNAFFGQNVTPVELQEFGIE
jgi:hypothetical protein